KPAAFPPPVQDWPLYSVLGKLAHSLDGVRECATILYPAAMQYEHKQHRLTEHNMARATYLLRRHRHHDTTTAAAMRIINNTLDYIHRFQAGPLPVLLPRSLFYTIFSLFDSYVSS